MSTWVIVYNMKERKDPDRAGIKVPRGLHTLLRLQSVKEDRPIQEIVSDAVMQYLRRQETTEVE